MKAIREEDFLYARIPSFINKVSEAGRLIEQALKRTKAWSISFSGGKDSLVTLHLVRLYVPDMPAVFIDSGTEFPETLEFVRSIKNVITGWPQKTLFEIYDECGEHQNLDMPPEIYYDSNQIVKILNQEPIARTNEAHDFEGNFTGIRKDEAVGRYWMGKIKKGLWTQKNGIYRCEPLLNWTANDIWSYIASRKLPYNPVYDRLAEIEVPRKDWRVAPFAGSTGLGFGRWAVLKKGWPELFGQFAKRFPKVRSYV